MATQQKLEEVLMQVEKLRKGLSAEIVVQEGKGHEDGYVGWGDGKYQHYVDERHWVEDQPRVAHPDTDKQEESRQRLQQVYDSSQWYSARYVAGRAIGKNNAELDSKIDGWLGDLYERAWLPKTKQIIVGEHEETREYTPYNEDSWSTRNVIDTIKVTDYEEIIAVENIEPRKNARKDLIKLFQLSNSQQAKGAVRDIANVWTQTEAHSYPDKEGMIEAGKALDYSSLRIWMNVHPRLSLALMVTAVLASEASYGLYQYMNR